MNSGAAFRGQKGPVREALGRCEPNFPQIGRLRGWRGRQSGSEAKWLELQALPLSAAALAAGLAIGVVGDAGVRANGQKNILIALILMMIFAEALALYGFIIAIVLVMSS